MKSMKLKIAQLALCLSVASMFSTTVCACTSSAAEMKEVQSLQQLSNTKAPKIQLAILLDTSSSMDGLIDQAKARLWNIVNTMTALKFKGQAPVIEIAVYEYGNSRLQAQNGYIMQVTPFTTDLDLVSEVLFGLRTGGGEELCGEVIQTAVNQLVWEDDPNSMKLIYIAGNESFDQKGVNKVDYLSAIGKAVKSGVFVNTIHCGDTKDGIGGYWKRGAEEGMGKYFNIDQNRAIRYVATPYDKDIERLNESLNATYHGYGRLGASNKAKQVQQDKNAKSMDAAVSAERSVSKAKAQYFNANWDMVDAYKQDKEFVKKVDRSTLPQEFKGLNDAQIEAKLLNLEKDRKTIQKDIDKLSSSRQKYIDQQQQVGNKNDDLGAAITNSIKELATKKNYTFG